MKKQLWTTSQMQANTTAKNAQAEHAHRVAEGLFQAQ